MTGKSAEIIFRYIGLISFKDACCLDMVCLCLYSFKNKNNKDVQDQAFCGLFYKLLIDGWGINNFGYTVLLCVTIFVSKKKKEWLMSHGVVRLNFQY